MKKPRKDKSGSGTTKKVLNPFEVHINKQKMTVLGQKTKNDRGLPGVSRAKAIKKRKQTILQEYKLQHKSNKFTDRRIGERSRDLSSEDKLVARFAAIRKKAHKKSIFNLADDEVLTHRGQTLSEIEKFDNPCSDEESDDEEKGGFLDSNFVEDAHFGGGILKKTSKEGAKTHRELIDELIAESKKRKAEKQKTKEATLELTEKLDTEWKDLLPLVNKKPKEDNREKEAIDDYDKVMRELRFEARGTVSDRLKTEDEIAKEEKEKLEELEEERQRRMRGFEDDKKVYPHRSADDLDDDFHYEEDPEYTLSYNQEGEANVEIEAEINGKKIKGNENEESEKEELEEEEEESEKEELEEEENDEDNEEEEDDLSDLKAESDEESDDSIKESEIKSNKNKKKIANEDPELPYTFSIPDSFDDFQKLLENRSSFQQGVIIERMIKCNHPSLSDKNKERLRTLFAYLLQHLNDYGLDHPVESFEIFNMIVPHLFDLTQLDKENAYFSLKEVIMEKHDDYKKHPKNYPGLETLLFFKLVSILFPTSDFRHQVVTPCLVFMEQMLFKCRVKSRRDLAFGLFLVTLVLEYTSLSRRYFPAAINYLGGLLHMAIPKLGVKLIKVKPPFHSTNSLLVLCNDFSNEDIGELKMRFSDLSEEKIDDFFKIRTTYTVLKLIKEFDDHLWDLASNVEIFNDCSSYLRQLPIKNYPKLVQKQFQIVLEQLDRRKNERKLVPLVMASEKPKALRLYEPKIEEVFDGKRRKNQPKERAEREKLLHKIKKETKGALREIRRDRAFLGRVKIQQKIKSDYERKDKVKRIYAEAAIQQSELNAIDRKKKKKN